MTLASSSATYTTYRWLKAEDFTAFGHHYGGNIIKWAEEEAGLYAARQLGTFDLATVAIASVGFPAPLAKQEEILKLEIRNVSFGATSLRFAVSVSASRTQDVILDIAQITFVALNGEGRPRPHGFTADTDNDSRLTKTAHPLFA